jgi:hypothetical protein
MLNRRYSHQRAARIASPILVLFGLAGGAVAARVIPGSPTPVFNAVLWGVVGGIAGYIVFASEGPQQRPASIVQAAVADGVVAGIIIALSGALVDVISASGAGSSTPGTLSLGGAVLAVVLAAILGALVGACAGALALAVGGRERFERLRVTHRKKGSSASRAKPRTPNRKPARQRRRR